MASVLESLGGVEATAGRLDMSAWMFAAAERLREATGTPLSPVEREDRERHVADLRVALGEEAFAARWAEGRSMSLEQIIATSLEPAGD